MRSYQQYCALARALDHVGGRWTLLIVRELLLGPKRFTDLGDNLPGIATNLLTDRLRALQADGIVHRRELPPPAASVVYELTELGRGLEEPVHALVRWGSHWMTTGSGGNDAFRPEWLAVALEALGSGQGLQEEVVVDLRIGSETTRLRFSEGDISVGAPDETSAPDLEVACRPETLLGIASGRHRLEDALTDELRLAGDDPETTFRRVFVPREAAAAS